MCYKKLYLIFLLAGIVITGCNKSPGDTSTHAFIGGRIINPTANYVILLKNNIPLDTVFLDPRNGFSYKVEDVEDGLYLIKHTPESHIVHLEAGDSILLRTNSLDFDGSLHFSGVGGEKNNFLVEMSLLNSNNTNLILSYYKMEPSEFSRKTDSIKQERLDLLQKRHQKYDFSDSFLEIANKSIDYEHYDLKERYTYMVNKYYKEFFMKIPQDFHAYRNNLDFNEEALQTSPSYIRFIENYLINQAMAECASANLDENDCYDLYDHTNITTRINLIDSLTELPLVKNHFFSKFGALGIIMAKTREEIVNVLELLQEKGYNEKELEKLSNLGRIQLAYLPGMNMGKVPLINTSGEEILYEEVSNQPTVIFLWSIYSPTNHLRNHSTIRELRKKYPEIRFIGINVDSGETSNWINVVDKYNYDQSSEFQLAPTEVEEELFKYYLNKSLFLDSSGEVIIGDAYINSPEFETRVLELLNQ